MCSYSSPSPISFPLHSAPSNLKMRRAPAKLFNTILVFLTTLFFFFFFFFFFSFRADTAPG